MRLFMTNRIVISAADAGYFLLLSELLESLRLAQKDLAQTQFSFDIGILDLGLTGAQRCSLIESGIIVVQPGWDIPGIQLPDHQRWYQAMTARPFLPAHFPHHELLMWLDADTWVQDSSIIPIYFQAAQQYGFGIVPEIHRSYHVHYAGSGALAMHRGAYTAAFGEEVAEQLMGYPILNSGAFAAHHASPVWKQWAEICTQAMSRGPTKHSEQAALNLTLYSGSKDSFHPLPARFNWVCPLANPLWDVQQMRLVEPALPHDVIGLVHLCHSLYHQPLEVTCVGGGALSLGFRRRFVVPNSSVELTLPPTPEGTS